jgi:hypothetical protein
MDTEDGLIVALILSKRLRTMLLKASLAAPVVGIIWIAALFFIGRLPENGLFAMLFTLPPVLMIVTFPAMFIFWLGVTIRAKLYQIAAEDARDLVDEIGFIDRREDE